MRLIRFLTASAGAVILLTTLGLEWSSGWRFADRVTFCLRLLVGILLLGCSAVTSSDRGRARLQLLSRQIASQLFRLLILLVMLNVVLGLIFQVRDLTLRRRLQDQTSEVPGRGAEVDGEQIESGQYFLPTGAPVDNGYRSDYQLGYFDYTACPEVPAETAARVLDEFYRLGEQGIIYQPWVQFSEAPFDGQYVSVALDEFGFPYRPGTERAIEGNDELLVFTFGGSTTFGYHVADDSTWPCELERVLNEFADGGRPPVRVRNYGRGAYYPTQEVMLLWDLLRAGHRPDLVIFMDGVNMGSFMDVPHFTRQFVSRWRQLQDRRSLIPELLQEMPLARLARGLNRRVVPTEQTPIRDNELELEMVPVIVRRFSESWRMADELCRHYGIRAVFCLQPGYLYGYNTQLYRQRPSDEDVARWDALTRQVYEQLVSEMDCIDLGGLYADWGRDRKAILDDCHYTPAFNRFLAERLAVQLDLNAKASSSKHHWQVESRTGQPRQELVPRPN